MRTRASVFWALILALLMAAGMLVSCGQAASSAPPAASQDQGTPESQAGTENEPSSKLTVEVFDRANENGSDPTNNYWTDWIKEQTLAKLNIEVEFIPVPRTEEVLQLNVLMASGDPPDICYTYTQSIAHNFYTQGGLADLTDAVAQYGAQLKEQLGEDILEYGQYDGRQYMIPAKRVSTELYATWIRKDWLDALDLPVPTTTQEFFDTMVAFKRQNPGGVENVIPFGLSSSLPWTVGSITDSFVEYSSMSEEELFVLGVNANDSATAFLYPGFKEGIRFVNKMYNNGLLDNQFPLYRDFSPVDELIKRGEIGAFHTNFDWPLRSTPGDLQTLQENVPGAELIPIDPFVNADGKHLKQIYTPVGLYLMVPAVSNNVDGAVQYLDWLVGDDVRNYLALGEEGVNHQLDDNGIPEILVLQNDPRMFNSGNNSDYVLPILGVQTGDLQRDLLVAAKAYQPGYEDLFFQVHDICMTDAVVYNPILMSFEADATYGNTLNDKRQEVLANAIVASEADFDAVYEAGMDEWLAIGGQECIDERQAYWDSTH